MKRQKKPECLVGNWNPRRAAIARVIQRYPLKGKHKRGPNPEGEIYNQSRIGRENDASDGYVSQISLSLELGAKIPTETELQAAIAADIEIPIDPNPPPPPPTTKIVNITGIPIEVPITPAASPVAKIEAPAAKPAEAAAKVEPITEKPAEPPKDKPADISGLDMQKEVDKVLENKDKREPLIIQPPATPDKKNGDHQAADQAAKLSPDGKSWHEKPAAEVQKVETQKPTETTEIKPAAEAKAEEKSDGRKILVGGELFGNVQKIKLTMGTIFWYFWCVNVYGFEGSMDDFLNWAVTDAIKARGLSLDVKEAAISVSDAKQ